MTNPTHINRGGRAAKKSADYFPMPGHRTDELKELKLAKGSEGIDAYLSVFEKLCVSEYFIWHYSKEYKLRVFAKDNGFDPEIFKIILEYMVEELDLFDKKLYQCGYIFSYSFVDQFEQAGLFAQRKIKAFDIVEHAHSFLPKEENSDDSNDDLPDEDNDETNDNLPF
jgi:hypothetical protein